MKKNKAILTSLYEIRRVKDGVATTTFREFRFTTQANWSVCQSDIRSITPALELIAEREKLNLSRFEQFEMCMDALKYSVSWN
jgi:hypothetical protein